MKVEKICSLLFVFLFFAMSLVHLVPEQSFDSEREKRPAAAPPTLLSQQRINTNFLTDFDAWFNDHFLLRGDLISLYYKGMYTLFGKTTPEVVAGKDEWLFLPSEVAAVAENALYTPEQLQTIVDNQLAMYEACQEKGIEYFVVIVPNKITVYPEYAPSYIDTENIAGKMDQVLDALAKTPIKAIDVRQALLAHKDEDALYLQTDSHWNELGAYYAYREIIQAIGTVGEPMPLESYAVTRRVGDVGDLQLMTALPENVLQSKSVSFSFAPLQKAPYTQTVENYVTHTAIENSTLPRVIVYGDSFLAALLPFLPNHFRNGVYGNATLYHETLARIVEKNEVDIVVSEIVERNLDFWLVK